LFSFGVNYQFLILSVLAYFLMNVLFAARLKRVLNEVGYHIRFSELLMAQYGGMLASDFTPARAGYLVAAAILNPFVPVSVGASAILFIQSFEFLVKVCGAFLGIFFLASLLEENVLSISLMGIGVMLVGAIVILYGLRSEGIASLLGKVSFTRRFVGMVAAARDACGQLGLKVVAEVVLFTLICWVVKGTEWWLIGQALGIAEVTLLGFFLIHPLVTALSFVPLTPSGMGFQDGATVGVLYLLGVPIAQGVLFALLARFLLVLEDLIGLYPISKIGFQAVGRFLTT
jgi:hypothetical protein